MDINSQKHIVYVVARFLPFFGGAEQNCYQIAKRTAAAGHKVTILTTDLHPQGEKLPSFEQLDGINIVRVHAWNRELSLGFYPQLFSKLLNMDIDVIHVCNGAGFIWRDICLFAKKITSPKTEFIITPHGPFLATPKTHKGLKRLITRLVKLPMKLYFKLLWQRLFKYVIAVNPRQENWLKADFGFRLEQIQLIPNGIEPSYVEPRLPKKSKDQFIVSYIGRLAKYKGVHKLISVVQNLLDKELNIKLLIMGSGDYEQELRDTIVDQNLDQRVELIINPADDVRDENLRLSDVNILLSDWEATGIVLLEAMAKGNVVITSSQNEAATLIIEPGINGFIVDKDELDELTRLLREMCIQPKKVREMQIASLKVAKKFNWDEIFVDYNNLLQKLIK